MKLIWVSLEEFPRPRNERYRTFKQALRTSEAIGTDPFPDRLEPVSFFEDVVGGVYGAFSVSRDTSTVKSAHNYSDSEAGICTACAPIQALVFCRKDPTHACRNTG